MRVPDAPCGRYFHNGTRYLIPHILALSTSSPFWNGRMTGLKSYRAVVFSDLPRTGLPDYFRDWSEFNRFVDSLVNTGCIPDGSTTTPSSNMEPAPTASCGCLRNRAGI